MELIFFNSRDQLLRIDMAEIVYFDGDGNLTYIVTSNKMKGTVNMNLGKMEEFWPMSTAGRPVSFCASARNILST